MRTLSPASKFSFFTVAFTGEKKSFLFLLSTVPVASSSSATFPFSTSTVSTWLAVFGFSIVMLATVSALKNTAIPATTRIITLFIVFFFIAFFLLS